MRLCVLLLATTLPLSLVPAAAHAEETAEEQPERQYLPTEIVVTGARAGYEMQDGSSGTKTPTPIIRVPQAIAAITRDQLDDQNLRALNDALRFVPGVGIGSGEGHRDELFIRGQRTTADFYLDGLRDDAQYYRPLYNVERVEVLKGPNALIFGRGAGGGAINRVSKVAEPGRSGAGAAASIDTFGAFDISGDVSAALSDTAALRLNGIYEEFDNERDAFGGRFIGINPTVTAQLGERTRLSAGYTYDDDRRVTDRGLPPFAGRPLRGFDKTFFGDRDYNTSTLAAHILRARIDHRLSGSASANLAVQYADYDKYYGNIVPELALDTDADGRPDSVRLSGYDSATQRSNFIGQGNLVFTGATGAINHTLLLGAEFTRQDTDAQRNRVRFGTGQLTATVPLAGTIRVPAFGTETQLGSRSELEVVSAYVQDQVEITPWLEVIGGVRFDRFALDSVNTVTGFAARRAESRWSPRFGLILKPADTVSLYASYSESFLPASGDQFTVLSASSAVLEPEAFTSREIGIKWAPATNLLATAAVFRLDRSNTPATDAQGLTVLTGESRIEGAEFSLAGSVTRRLHLNVGYTYLDGEVRSATSAAPAGRRLPQVPEHQLGAWARYNFTDRLGLGFGVIHQSSQFASFTNAVMLPAYTRVDAAAFFQASDRLSFQVNVENLTDARYYPSAHNDINIQPGRPLHARVGVRLAY
ncbi:TonB-dependent siderophore receptor [Erythrobacteraceae bacterium CFH 75059]|uniref:TonB-dependent receptor n=1 Tax=Qipengyuania thermophila TaxID=2509361 RepID=UPI0010218C43|nr:TonB-dependent siderophore receptor [Qipengyuania thermophila]TCD04103.1 TonB-dependent siderophore receptor [Erythrobacteraceae bacterium CFH 75059]